MERTGTRAEKRAATAERILEAAREEFAERGPAGATIRRIAGRAGVDPSLVMQHYGSKSALFALAVRPVAELDEADGKVGIHLEQVLLARFHELDAPTRALMRSMLSSPEAADAMSAYLDERASALAAGGDRDRHQRAAILVASIMGVTMARHFLDVPALRDIDAETAAQILGEMLPGGD
ncbi:TetR family transcriptional regulator [Microbacterium testaceum]|uniref:TetR family transcriptional regulator n=1 Tax=Microbacterium testaceum TaxID=2033 RepID=A0A4Y3QQ91_MICTE|nr:TetR/AcrR family transcriptional regulator [Microbacterium testaceum]GEB46578.1 TetR family transcriptional regulator [Microbacterium testaceum]